MQEDILIAVCEPGQQPYLKIIENHFMAMQEVIGGYAEMLYLGQGIGLICDEDGHRKGLPFNRMVAGQTILGTFFLTAVKIGTGEQVSLSDEQAQHILEDLPGFLSGQRGARSS